MTIYQQCPRCREKQSNANKKCKCGEDLDRAKRSNRVKYWLYYRDSNGTQVKESVDAMDGFNGFSIEDARLAHSQRVVQKREGQVTRESSKLTFDKLTEWYLKLETVKALASYNIIKVNLNKFNTVFGNMLVRDITSADLENYQERRKQQGKAPGTIDHEIGKAKTMINKARDNDLVTAKTKETFERVKKTLKAGTDVRDRILSPDEFKSLIKHSAGHIQGMITIGYYTGMRKGEIVALTWDHVDLAARMIRLEAEDTKDREARSIPICDELYKYLKSLPTRIQDTGKDNHIFQFKGQPIKGDIRDGLKNACKEAKIKYGRFVKGGFIFHDLRHTFNTNMRKAGVQESVIMAITGHSTREMFDRYNTVDEEDTKSALRKLESFIVKSANAPQNAPQKDAQGQATEKNST